MDFTLSRVKYNVFIMWQVGAWTCMMYTIICCITFSTVDPRVNASICEVTTHRPQIYIQYESFYSYYCNGEVSFIALLRGLGLYLVCRLVCVFWVDSTIKLSILFYTFLWMIKFWNWNKRIISLRHNFWHELKFIWSSFVVIFHNASMRSCLIAICSSSFFIFRRDCNAYSWFSFTVMF